MPRSSSRSTPRAYCNIIRGREVEGAGDRRARPSRIEIQTTRDSSSINRRSTSARASHSRADVDAIGMGIASLLPTLKSISRHAHVGETYAGQVVCVDAYVWLHRGAYACSRELCEGLPTRKHVEYFLNRARTLKRANVRAIYVFDGGR